MAQTTKFSKQEKRILLLAATGGMLEFYDFVIYGIFSIYFAKQFFPSHDSFVVILQSYLVFVLGYLARPIGGIIFSHIGDEYGRKKVLIITIMLMGIASLGIGLLPTYEQIGLWAPVLLLSLRLIQGLALGGELPSTYVYIIETIQHCKGRAFGIIMSVVCTGLLLGMVINFILSTVLTSPQLAQYGWRIPFVIGGLICVISYRIRKTLHESTVFTRIHDRPRLPLIYFFQHYPGAFLIGTALVAIVSSMVVTVIIFMPTYLKEMLHWSLYDVNKIMVIGLIVNAIVIYATGFLADQISPWRVAKGLVIFSLPLIPLGYALLITPMAYFGVILLISVQAVAAMISPYLLSSLFESKIRLTGVSLCYNIGFTLFGGLAPLIITHFIRVTGAVYWVPVSYLLIMVFIGGIGFWKAPLLKHYSK